eukprot:8044387-Pyramimonas_sp.AAC.1
MSEFAVFGSPEGVAAVIFAGPGPSGSVLGSAVFTKGWFTKGRFVHRRGPDVQDVPDFQTDVQDAPETSAARYPGDLGMHPAPIAP